MVLVLGLALLLLAGFPGAHGQPNTNGLAFTGDGFGEAQNPSLSENALTVELWVKHTGESDTDAVLVSNRIDLDDGSGYVMHLDGDGEDVHVAFRPGGQNKDHVVSETSLEKGRWYHVAGTYEQTSGGSSTTLFINGVEDASTTQGDFDSINNENALVLGSTEDGSGNFFRGGLDDVRVWNEALSGVQISANLNSEFTGSEEGLAAYFTLNEASGSSFANAATDGEGSLMGEYTLSAPGSIPPVAPTDVHAAPGDGQVTVHFERPDYAETSVSEYTVYRTAKGGSRQQIATVGASQRTYSDTDVSQNTLHFYEVTATTDGGTESDYSERTHATVTDRSGLRFAGSENVEFNKTASLNGLEGGTEVAVDLWLKFEASSETDAVVLANKSGFSDDGYLLRLVGEGAERRIKFEPGSDPVTSETALVAGQWYHVTATYSDANTSTTEIFINGAKDASNSTANFDSIDSDEPLVFGSRAGGGNFLTGAISDVRLWSTTSINPGELINQPSIGNEEGLIGYWRFDEPQGSSVIRSSARPLSAPLPSGVALDTRGPQPAAPIAVRTRPDSGNVEVHFQQPEYTQATISEYGIYRAEGTGERQQIATIGGDQTTYTDRDVETGTLYFYEVIAATPDGRESDFSSPEAATAYQNPGGNALQLSGTNSSVNFGQTPSLKDLEKGTAVGVDFWMKFDAESDANAILIGNKVNIGSGNDGFSLHLVGDGAERQLKFEPGSDPVTSETALVAGQWYHVTATYSDANTSTTEIFINGAKDVSNSTANFDSINNDNPLVLGSSADESSNFFQGTIDEVRLWKTAALTPSDLTDQILIGNEENLVGYWRLNEPAGSDVARSSAKPLSGTISNGTFVMSNVYSQGISVTGVQPAQAPPGATVKIYGGGFSTTASENTVTFGSATATVTNATQNSLTVTVPAGVVGPTTLTVEKNGESVTAARRFTALQTRTTVRSLTGTDVGLDGLRNGSVALGDLNGDNMIDVAMVGEGASGTPTTRLYENNGDGTYTAMNAGLTGVTDGSVALGDLNGDNRLDVVIAGEKGDGTPVTKLYRNDGSGSFTAMNAGLPGLRSGSVALGDLNGNNMIDVAMVGEGAGGTPTTRLYSNDESGSFTAMNAGLTDLTNGSVALGDLNGDNRLDVAVLGEQSDGTPTTRLYQNDGGGSFSALSSLTGLTNGSIALGDLDGDNHLDVATVGEESGGTPVTRLYSNDGSGSFSALNAGLTGVSDGAVALGDLNGNNRIDLAIAGTDADGNGVLDAYRNTPEGWTAVGPGPIGFIPQRDGMAFGDAEGDGDLDLVAVGNGVGSESTPGAGVFENVYPTPSGVTASAGTGEAALDWQKTTGSQLATYRLYRSTAPIDSLGDPSGLTPFDSVSAGTTSYTDADLDEGQTYYYRVTAVAETDEGSPLSVQDYAFLYPGSVTADVSRSFDDASSAEDYRLVALPGQVDRPLESTLNGEAGTEWQAYWDDGSDSDFLLRFDGSEAFTLERGRGFWLTSQSDWTVEDSLETVDLKNDTSTTVPLNSGWTIISNPLGKSVDWALVERANGGDLQPLWEFGGTFTQAQSFASASTGTAYYFFNDTGKDSLTVPYPGAPQFREVPKTGQAENAMLALSATSARGDAPASTVRVGIAKTEDARQSIIAPPGRFAETSLRIEAPGEADSKRAGTLMAERRPRGDEPGQTFRLRLTYRADGPVQLTAEHLGAIDGRAVALLHPSAGKTYDLREEETVEIEPEAETTELKVAIGTDSYVKDQTDKVLPDEVTLTSYPNPARQQGTVEYALPEKTEVTLRLYDVLGREVATIAQGRKTAGRHRVQLEVGRLASGVYFGRLQVGDQTLTQKITVVR